MQYLDAASKHELSQLNRHAASNSDNHGDVITRHDQDILIQDNFC